MARASKQRRRRRTNPWPGDLPADVQVALDELLVKHQPTGEAIVDGILAYQGPLDVDSLPFLEHARLEAERRSPMLLALASISQTAYRRHAHHMDDLIDISERHLIEARKYNDGVREYLHSLIMKGFGDGTVSDEHGMRPTYERVVAREPDEVSDWPLTFEEIRDLTNNNFIVRYSERGGEPTYEAYGQQDPAFERDWLAIEDDYAPPEEEFRITFTNGDRHVDVAGWDNVLDELVRRFGSVVIGHDGDLDNGGDSTLFWRTEEDAADDDGARALGEVTRRD